MIVATGRMFRSVRPYLEEAGIAEPVVCYQGAAVVDPASGAFLLHEPIPLETRAGGGRAADGARLLAELLRRRPPLRRPAHRVLAHVRGVPAHSRGGGRRPRCLARAAADEARRRRRPGGRAGPAGGARCAAFGDRLFLTTSLPYLLELGNPAVSKGTGIAFVAERLGISLERIVSFGDGENDIELIEEAGFGIAVEDANPLLLEHADWVCPSADDEGVATVIDAYLESIA